MPFTRFSLTPKKIHDFSRFSRNLLIDYGPITHYPITLSVRWSEILPKYKNRSHFPIYHLIFFLVERNDTPWPLTMRPKIIVPLEIVKKIVIRSPTYFSGGGGGVRTMNSPCMGCIFLVQDSTQKKENLRVFAWIHTKLATGEANSSGRGSRLLFSVQILIAWVYPQLFPQVKSYTIAFLLEKEMKINKKMKNFHCNKIKGFIEERNDNLCFEFVSNTPIAKCKKRLLTSKRMKN